MLGSGHCYLNGSSYVVARKKNKRKIIQKGGNDALSLGIVGISGDDLGLNHDRSIVFNQSQSTKSDERQGSIPHKTLPNDMWYEYP